METEGEFSIATPDSPTKPVGKRDLHAAAVRIRDFAEYAFLNRGTGSTVAADGEKGSIRPDYASDGFGVPTALSGLWRHSPLRVKPVGWPMRRSRKAVERQEKESGT